MGRRAERSASCTPVRCFISPPETRLQPESLSGGSVTGEPTLIDSLTVRRITGGGGGGWDNGGHEEGRGGGEGVIPWVAGRGVCAMCAGNKTPEMFRSSTCMQIVG